MSRVCPHCGQPIPSATERAETISRMWLEGRSTAEIAQELGTTTWSITGTISQLRRAGVELPYRYPAAARK